MKSPACGCGRKAFLSEKDVTARFEKIRRLNLPGEQPTGFTQCHGGVWHLKFAESDTGPSPKLRSLVEARDQVCVRCGLQVPRDEDSIHHRIPRGRGGENTAENLLLLCGSGTTGCHGWVESHRAEAYNAGYLVHTGIDPLDVPVLLRGTNWAYPTPDGKWVISGHVTGPHGSPSDLFPA
ncbi:HNH endonuclease [Nonomuraea sp. NPDC003560]|uniref:HNH endonuclease n=1 Tax=Nonomuraea sp. NPDC003560 TaxID=3364341 RepID=UPI0036ADDE7F